MKKICAIVGPTASGKTALALRLAEHFDGEIISCDSMQIYREMNIGTAKPTDEERARVVHHLVDVASVKDTFSCADYREAAGVAVGDIISRGRLPVFCGGTGLYLDSVLRGGGFEETKTDFAYREEMKEYARVNGAEALHAILKELDPEAAEAIHPNNIKRVIRALEIIKTSNVTKTEADRLSRVVPSEYDALIIGIYFHDRERLYGRINLRVDKMLENGLADEVRALDADGVFTENATAAQAIGYKELLPYIHGECDLETAVTELKTATRHYAKRQMTWFSRYENIVKLYADEQSGKSDGGENENEEQMFDEAVTAVSEWLKR